MNNWELRDGDLVFMCKASLILRMKSLEEESITLKLERGEEEQQELQERIWRKIVEENLCKKRSSPMSACTEPQSIQC